MQPLGIRIYWPIGLTREMPGRTGRADLIERTLGEYVRQVVEPSTTVSIGWMKRTTSLLSSIYLGMINDAQVVSDILDAEAQGYDAAMIGPHWDPGLLAAREAARIPVAGPGESAMMVAQTLGSRFAFLTVHEGYVPMLEHSIKLSGYETRAIAQRPVRRFGMTYENLVASLEGTSDEFLAAFEKTARECIADGADVIIIGGQLFGPVLVKHQFFAIPNTGVPVVEVAACGLKMAEVLVKLRRAVGLKKSEHPNAPYRTPPRDMVDVARRAFGFG